MSQELVFVLGRRRGMLCLPARQAGEGGGMKKLLVAVVLVVVACAIAQTGKSPQPAKQPTAAVTAPQNHVGKYQMFFSPHARADVYLVDTETGQIWKPVQITNARDTNFKGSAPTVWVYQERIDNEREFDAWVALHKTETPVAAPQQ